MLVGEEVYGGLCENGESQVFDMATTVRNLLTLFGGGSLDAKVHNLKQELISTPVRIH